MTPPTPASDVAERLVADWRLRKFAGIMPASAEDDLKRRISAALLAEREAAFLTARGHAEALLTNAKGSTPIDKAVQVTVQAIVNCIDIERGVMKP